MRQKKFFIAVLALSSMAMSAGFTSCTYIEEPLYGAIYGAEAIPGPWSNNGYSIEEIGWGEYRVFSAKTQTQWIEYLNPMSFYYSSLPEGYWPERYEPYFAGPPKNELCWHVYCRQGEVLIFKTGRYAIIN